MVSGLSRPQRISRLTSSLCKCCRDAVGYCRSKTHCPHNIRLSHPESESEGASLEGCTYRASRWLRRRQQSMYVWAWAEMLWVSVLRLVRIPQTTDTSFTPTFGAYYDTNHHFGGYYDSMDAMHGRCRTATWKRQTRLPIPVGQGYRGVLGETNKGKAKETADDILEENARLIEELQAWQEVRLQKGSADWTCEREQQVAEELLASLAKLAESTQPSDLLPRMQDTSGMAHRLAQQILQNKAPSIRGTLDPRRPHALHDNLTVRPKSVQNINAAATTPSSYPTRQSTVYQPPRQQPSYPSPTPYRPPTPNYTYTSPFAQQAPGANGPRIQQAQYRPPAAGPSALRQSFGPGAGQYGSHVLGAGAGHQRVRTE